MSKPIIAAGQIWRRSADRRRLEIISTNGEVSRIRWEDTGFRQDMTNWQIKTLFVMVDDPGAAAVNSEHLAAS